MSASKMSRWSEMDISAEVAAAFSAGVSLVFDNSVGAIQGLRMQECGAEGSRHRRFPKCSAASPTVLDERLLTRS
jgi:hypothetical protein